MCISCCDSLHGHRFDIIKSHSEASQVLLKDLEDATEKYEKYKSMNGFEQIRDLYKSKKESILKRYLALEEELNEVPAAPATTPSSAAGGSTTPTQAPYHLRAMECCRLLVVSPQHLLQWWTHACVHTSAQSRRRERRSWRRDSTALTACLIHHLSGFLEQLQVVVDGAL